MVISHKHEQGFFSNATFLRFFFLIGGLLLVFQSCNYGATDLSRLANIEVPIFTLNRIMSSEEILKKMLASDTKNDLVASVLNNGLVCNSSI